MKTPYMCIECGKTYATQNEAKNCDHKKNSDIVLEAVIVETKKTLLELYNEDKSIVNALKEKELKSLCKSLDIKYTNEEEIREHLKALEPLV